ncbi:hypothetical protein GCM10010315_40460 [Streptomyces luteosporeus]|uniref:Uncharacterized protein n=1 Tax=Streptomyces luteosporeus TaxID=173856 RepID=A0ABN3TXW0_9ACTN
MSPLVPDVLVGRVQVRVPAGPRRARRRARGAQHGGSCPADGVRAITGEQVVIGLVVLVVLAWAMRVVA